eukprot:CAMPEP_0206501524 /NCGR_PEP_ID=MMETSP0324_2-20121206/53375_1 /ASSEMBLY_ACC=CAM_ASM_000836 /TAXON_ID=2866 /ORGANISM="Crypthecodinium cohnii, Strain Seligo" /LENGTH=41 /DNA_ID= /DNA_START= /DNA_END= /DNA_ORIENTATION=
MTLRCGQDVVKTPIYAHAISHNGGPEVENVVDVEEGCQRDN